MTAGWTEAETDPENEMIVHNELLSTMPCSRPGWYAFFEDPDDEECPIWAEAIEAWGTFAVPVTEDGDVSIQVRAMKVSEETGTLDASFIDAENFLGVLFSRLLAETARSNMIEYHEFMSDYDLMKRLETIVRVRHTPVNVWRPLGQDAETKTEEGSET